MHSKAPRTPTRSCPHPWCRRAHQVQAVVTVVSLAVFLSGISTVLASTVFALLFVIAACITFAQRSASGKTTREKLAEDAAPVPPVQIRAGWARAAVAHDAITTAFYATVAALIAVGSIDLNSDPDASVAYLIPVLIGVAVLWEATGRALHRRGSGANSSAQAARAGGLASAENPEPHSGHREHEDDPQLRQALASQHF